MNINCTQGAPIKIYDLIFFRSFNDMQILIISIHFYIKSDKKIVVFKTYSNHNYDFNIGTKLNIPKYFQNFIYYCFPFRKILQIAIINV